MIVIRILAIVKSNVSTARLTMEHMQGILHRPSLRLNLIGNIFLSACPPLDNIPYTRSVKSEMTTS